MFNVIAGLVILLLVLVVVVWRPRTRWTPHGLPVFIPAAIGAIVALTLGLVGLTMLGTIVSRVWDASFTLIGLFLLAAALEANHFFEWAALRLAKIADGSSWRLYLLLCLLTIGVTIFLGNDGAILGMTAIVAKLVKTIFPTRERHWWPYIFAAGFLADSFSGFLVPDNLTNIIVASTYHLPFVTFMVQMALPMVLAAVVAISCFAIRFNTVLLKDKVKYDSSMLLKTGSVLKDQLVFKVIWIALTVLILGHLIVGGVFHQPASFVVVPVAVIVLFFVHFRKLRLAHEILFAAPWEVLLYALGMFVVITAAMTPTVITLFLSIQPLHSLIMGEKSVIGLFTTGGILAVLSAVTNNLPATLAGVLLLGTVAHPPMLAIYAVIIGVDIGPKLTPYGSLATLLWLGILKREGITISWGRCFKENWLITVFALTAALLGLLLVMP
ncbi:ArsB/NhaD family transporter [Tengunoibacter tsumagoiensis]|uniref:Arsenical pump membrane protein n=1 Tax=Tengunoibacter tsumagoiensis TaxID=2014871 RepID=A0A402AA38_9CHLR|nr:ArsB/NhaD family transporter [Tengunoibacter tsumagoiensis]GCE16010.1 arsenical pump membrane protein [Tengunoibacter tsumagoiensis]